MLAALENGKAPPPGMLCLPFSLLQPSVPSPRLISVQGASLSPAAPTLVTHMPRTAHGGLRQAGGAGLCPRASTSTTLSHHRAFPVVWKQQERSLATCHFDRFDNCYHYLQQPAWKPGTFHCFGAQDQTQVPCSDKICTTELHPRPPFRLRLFLGSVFFQALRKT